jgi:hypothetical protein
MHLLILCEGKTEGEVLEEFLKPFWSARFQSVEIQHYTGNGQLGARLKADAELQLRTEADSWVLCLVDLYKEPFRVYNRQRMSIEEGFAAVRKELYLRVDAQYHARFGGFPVVMELETWLLADQHIQQRMGSTFTQPENILHPVRELEKWYESRRKAYKKLTSGQLLFREASAERVYADNCPHFNQMADWLRNPPPHLPDYDPERRAAFDKKSAELYTDFERLYEAAKDDESLERAIEAEQRWLSHLASYRV